jgi:predicted DsbA family dithiol-disulfide isomerase
MRAVVGEEELPDMEPFELRPPPEPLVEVTDPSLSDRWSEARRLGDESGVSFAPPRLVPWSRKAHELHLLAREHGVAHEVRLAVYEAYLLEGRDIGRVDVLVELATAAGLDRTETKAVLDVDRLEADVAEIRKRALEAGVTGPPELVVGPARLRGFHNGPTLRTFLRGAPADRAR